MVTAKNKRLKNEESKIQYGVLSLDTKEASLLSCTPQSSKNKVIFARNMKLRLVIILFTTCCPNALKLLLKPARISPSLLKKSGKEVVSEVIEIWAFSSFNGGVIVVGHQEPIQFFCRTPISGLNVPLFCKT